MWTRGLWRHLLVKLLALLLSSKFKNQSPPVFKGKFRKVSRFRTQPIIKLSQMFLCHGTDGCTLIGPQHQHQHHHNHEDPSGDRCGGSGGRPRGVQLQLHLIFHQDFVEAPPISRRGHAYTEERPHQLTTQRPVPNQLPPFVTNKDKRNKPV